MRESRKGYGRSIISMGLLWVFWNIKSWKQHYTRLQTNSRNKKHTNKTSDTDTCGKFWVFKYWINRAGDGRNPLSGIHLRSSTGRAYACVADIPSDVNHSRSLEVTTERRWSVNNCSFSRRRKSFAGLFLLALLLSLNTTHIQTHTHIHTRYDRYKNIIYVFRHLRLPSPSTHHTHHPSSTDDRKPR